jgi:DNA polymerase-3 subunit gamma/tau
MPQSSPAVAAAPASSVDLTDLWSKILEAVGRASPFTRSYLTDAHPVSFEKNLLTIGFDPEFADKIGLVDNTKNHTLLQTKLHEFGFHHCQVKFIKAERPDNFQRPVAPVSEPAPPSAPVQPVKPAVAATAALKTPEPGAKPKLQPVPFNKDDFKNDPLIQKALEIFKGQIIEVRA